MGQFKTDQLVVEEGQAMDLVDVINTLGKKKLIKRKHCTDSCRPASLSRMKGLVAKPGVAKLGRLIKGREKMASVISPCTLDEWEGIEEKMKAPKRRV